MPPQRPEDRIDSIFATYDRPDSPGCAVGVYRAGEVVFANGYGQITHLLVSTDRVADLEFARSQPNAALRPGGGGDGRYSVPPQLGDAWGVASPEDVGLIRAPL